MKKSDIKQGGEYAYATYEWGSRERVRVVGESQIHQGYGYNRRTVTGLRVQVLEKRTGEPMLRKLNGEDSEPQPVFYNTTGRNIREEWAPYWENAMAQAKARRESADHLAQVRSDRAKLLLDLIPAMRHVGLPETDCIVRDTKVLAALQAHVEDCLSEVPSPYAAPGSDEAVWQFKAPQSLNLVEYVTNGAGIPVRAEDLLRIAR